MEYRDLYDENRKLTGEKILKDNKIPEGKYINTVVIFIENKRGELLLQVNKKHLIIRCFLLWKRMDNSMANYELRKNKVMSLLMVVGRLEILPILVLFSRRAWRKG